MTEAIRPRICFNSEAIETGYRLCHRKVRTSLREYMWIASNLPREQQNGLKAILWHWLQSFDLLDLESPNRLPIDVWSDVRSDVSDAFLEQCTSEELASLVHTVRKFKVSKQFLFDTLDGCDTWIRDQEIDSFAKLTTFAYRMGGAPLAASVPILGTVKAGYEVAAIRGGQAIFLTNLLANTVNLFKHNKIFLAKEDMEDCEIVPHKIKMRQGGEPWKNLVRLYCSRIEPLYYEAGQLVDYLDFDGKRTVTSLLAVHWRIYNRLKQDPELAMQEEGILSRKDWFQLKSRHFLGTEGNIPILSNHSDSPSGH